MIVLEYLALAIGILGIAVITWGAIKGAVKFIASEVLHLGKNRRPADSMTKIRVDVGQHLLLGLEFLIGADIILTVIEPGIEEIIILVVIVIVRTIISYFLSKEVENL